MKRILLIILICLLLPISVLAVSYGKTGESTNFNGDVGVPTGKGYYINGVQITSDALSDVASIAMLDEAETVTGAWTFRAITNFRFLSDPNDPPFVVLQRARDGDPTYDVSSGDYLGSIVFEGYHTNAYDGGATLRAIIDGTPGDNDMPGRLEFLTTPDDTKVLVLRMAIDNAGNIKMGDGAWTDYVQVTDSGAVTFEGASSITLPMAIITGLADVTSVDADYMIIWDSSENALKKVDMGEVRGGGSATAWDDIGNPDANDEIDFAAYVIELNVENFQIGDGGANYVDFADAGVVTLVGTSTICTVDSAEFMYLEGVTEEIQTALTAAARFADNEAVTGNWTLAGSGSIHGVDSAELTHVDGVTEDIQTALNTILANVVEDASPELGGEMDAGAHTIGFTMGTATGDGTTTIDWTVSNKFEFTHGAMAETFTFDPAPTNPCSLTLKIIQDGVGSRDCTWPATVKWLRTEPTWTDGGAGKVIIMSMFYDGTDYWSQGTPWES